MIILFLLILVLLTLQAYSHSHEQPNAITSPVYSLIERVSPQLLIYIELKYVPSNSDYFSISQCECGQKIEIKGNSQISLSVGFNYLLTKILRQSISGTGDNINSEQIIIPKTISEVTKRRVFKYTYYMNVCTYSYSMVGWDWGRWEKELDGMAMRGINLALAFNGQEYIYLETMKHFNISEEEVLNDYFAGPAFLAWQRMGNLQRWAGPPKLSGIQGQYELQLKILKRMNELGIRAVFPAFNGFVPEAFKRKYPKANITKAKQGINFSDNYTSVFFIEPTDPLAKAVSKVYTDNLQIHFGRTDHFYNGDQFNEMDPFSGDAQYLKTAGKTLIDGLLASDPQAVLIMQGWLFSYSAFWKDRSRVQAYLSGIDKQNIIILDLYSEAKPVYNTTNSYFGKPFIGNVLHNFGGRINIYGKLPTIMNGPFEALHYPLSSVIGIGITMEGITQNMIVYDLLLDVAWMQQPENLWNGTKEYITSRYGIGTEEIENCGNYLLSNSYNSTENKKGLSYIEERPKLFFKYQIYYNQCDIIKAGKNMILASQKIKKISDSFQYDLVDIGRQILCDLFAYLFSNDFIKSILDKDLELFRRTTMKMKDIILDLDLLLGTRKELLLGKGISNAEKWAMCKEEKGFYKFNAKNQITMGGPDANINDYAAKQWNGLIKAYYYIRGSTFFDEIAKAMTKGKEFDIEKFNALIFEFEKKGNYDMEDSYLTEPQGNPVEIAKSIMDKYREDFNFICKEI